MIHSILGSQFPRTVRGYTTTWRNSNNIIIKQIYFCKRLRFQPMVYDEAVAIHKLPYGWVYHAYEQNNKTFFVPKNSLNDMNTSEKTTLKLNSKLRIGFDLKRNSNVFTEVEVPSGLQKKRNVGRVELEWINKHKKIFHVTDNKCMGKTLSPHCLTPSRPENTNRLAIRIAVFAIHRLHPFASICEILDAS